ncbi:FecR family protein [Telluribacter sp.]|jgi:ferric-dicitrate binding protein FerR (iron transport regulator)|uniref:FecR family protein n=1 Tax=Telluribacter sp. TaxID=1978767 RepID=UPI002E15DAC7|nr:FecR domain-containing protein [Telluribacter sp.]
MEQSNPHIQDLLNDDTFVQWVLFGKNTAAWDDYLSRYPSHRTVIEEARQLLQEIHKAEEQTILSLDQEAVWSNIRGHMQEPAMKKQKVVRALWRRPILQWAASLILLLGVGWLVWFSQFPKTVSYQDLIVNLENRSSLIEQVNENSTPLKITLEDGSVITLDKNSRLSYPAHFDKDNRTVILTGEAFFDVAKDSSRPFYIYANEVVTKVLGTSFSIRAFDEENQIVVQVRTGRVSVYRQQRLPLSDPETKGLVLLPNQQATYSRIKQNLSRRLVEQPKPIALLTPSLPTRYEEVSASTILRDLENQYGITILFNDDELNHCLLTTTLGEEPLHDKLDIICQTIDATYKEVDGQLIVESKGCR